MAIRRLHSEKIPSNIALIGVTGGSKPSFGTLLGDAKVRELDLGPDPKEKIIAVAIIESVCLLVEQYSGDLSQTALLRTAVPSRFNQHIVGTLPRLEFGGEFEYKVPLESGRISVCELPLGRHSIHVELQEMDTLQILSRNSVKLRHEPTGETSKFQSFDVWIDLDDKKYSLFFECAIPEAQVVLYENTPLAHSPPSVGVAALGPHEAEELRLWGHKSARSPERFDVGPFVLKVMFAGAVPELSSL